MSNITHKNCKVERCNNVPQAYKDTCSKHLWRFRKYGEYEPKTMKKYELHGMAKSSTYSIWEGIIQRCYNKNTHKYSIYGGRGITMCDEWRHSFAAFLKDMGERPKGMTIDRIDSNKGYYKENCRWVGYGVQNTNLHRKTEGYKGVTRREGTKFAAEIAYDKKRFYIGYFDNEEWAAYMYDQWAISLYGEYASTNFNYM